jgi:very-short-patch-repair endonuclease
MRPYGGEKIHVTVPLTQRRGHEDVVVHRHCLEEDEITTRDGLPVTVPLRTILDVAQVIKGVPLERAIRQAEYHRLVAIESLVAAVDANPGRRGIRNLRRALVGCVEVPGLTRSALEEKFAHFVRRRALPRPRLNVQLHVADRIVEVDVLWPKHRVVVELDGKAAHANIRAFESDRARDGALQAAGYVVTRVTWQRLQRDQARLAAELRAILAHRE